MIFFILYKSLVRTRVLILCDEEIGSEKLNNLPNFTHPETVKPEFSDEKS